MTRKQIQKKKFIYIFLTKNYEKKNTNKDFAFLVVNWKFSFVNQKFPYILQ